MTVEEWRDIPGFSNYSISSMGRVLSRWGGSERLIGGSLVANGYRYMQLRDDAGERKIIQLHSLVLLAFVGPRPSGHVIRHLDGEKTDNSLANLAYGTHLENSLDTVRHGKHNNANKTHCPKGHPYDEANTIWRRGSRPWKGPTRLCRTCRRAIESRAGRAVRAAAKEAAA